MYCDVHAFMQHDAVSYSGYIYLYSQYSDLLNTVASFRCAIFMCHKSQVDLRLCALVCRYSEISIVG